MREKTFIKQPVVIAVLQGSIPELTEISSVLEENNFKIQYFENSARFLKGVNEAKPPDMILSGLTTTGITTWRLCRLLRSEEYAGFNRVPVLLVASGLSRSQTVSVRESTGADDVLNYPEDKKLFLDHINKLLKGEKIRPVITTLIVGIEEKSVRQIKKDLKPHSCKFNVTQNPDEGLAKQRRNPFDLIIIDLDSSERHRNRIVKDFRESAIDTVIIVISSRLNRKKSVELMEAGADDSLEKPFQQGALSSLCENLCYEKQKAISCNISIFKKTEENLRETTKQLRTINEQFEFILEATNTGIDIISSDFDLLYVDKRWQKKYGRYIGYKCYDYYMGRESPCPGCGIPRALETKRMVVTEEKLPRENDRIVRVHTIPFRDNEGNWKVAEFNIDITDIKKTEDALRESETKFRTLVEHSPVGIFLIDNNYKFAYANDELCRILGYTSDEVIGMDFRKIVAQQSLHLVTDRYRRRQKGEKIPEQYDFHIVHKNGEQRDVVMIAALIHDRQGKPQTMGQLLDITERKQTEEALKEREESLRSFINHSIMGVLIIDEDGKVIEWNRALERLSGITKAEAAGRLFWEVMVELIPPERLNRKRKQEIVKSIKSNLKNGIPISESLLEYDIVNKEGKRITTQLLVFSIKTPKGYRFGSLVQDITDRKNSEEALRTSEERLLLAKNSSLAGIWDYDIEKDYLLWDEQMFEMYGVKKSEFGNNYISFEKTVHKADLRRIRKEMQAALRNKKNFHSELRIVKPNGSVRYIEVDAIVKRTPQGKPIRMIGTNRDITDRKRVEAERLELERNFLHSQKLESLGVLAGGIAHDFNNLLTVIVGNLDLALINIPPDSPTCANVKKAIQATQRATDLTQQMLAYSGKGSFILKSININEIVTDNVHLFRASISKNVKLNLETAKTLPFIMADPGQIQQVVMNLLTNASEAIGVSNGTVTLKTGVMQCDDEYLCQSRLEEKPSAGRFVFLEVSDTGAGMNRETNQRLFDPFYTTKFAGRGLGLSAVLGIVRGHKGAIMVNSEIGKGTTFGVFFPSKGEFLPEKPNVSVAVVHAPADFHGSILVVDDEEAVRRTSVEFLSHLGIMVFEASDGENALELFKEKGKDIACVLLDLTMPKMDGLATFNEMKKLRPDLKVILCSGYSEKEATSRFDGRGLSAFLQKPFRLQELKSIIERVMQ